MITARDIIAVCQRNIKLYANDCSRFVRAVSQDCGVVLTGNANSIVSQLQETGIRLKDGVAAANAAKDGYLVIGGLKEEIHGHLVVVVDGPLNRDKYPYAFWGKYVDWEKWIDDPNGIIKTGWFRGHGTINWTWRKPVLDLVIYAAFKPIESIIPKAEPNEGYPIHKFI